MKSMIEKKKKQPKQCGLYIRQEHLAPTTAFSFAANAHEQFNAGFSPQEHFACEAQTHVEEDELRPQQVDGSAMLSVGCMYFSIQFGCVVRRFEEVISDDDFRGESERKKKEAGGVLS